MGSIKKAFKKVFGSKGHSDQSATAAPVSVPAPAPELGFVNTDVTTTTEAESEKQQLTKGKKRGKKSLKVNMIGASGAGRNIV